MRQRRIRAGASATIGVATALGAALVVRAIGFEQVFLEDGSVAFTLGDAYYHVRRALLGFLQFPSVPTFDAWLNHPDGAPIPYPPLYDFALAAGARLFGDSIVALERAAAWAPPLLGALTVLPIYALGRRLRGSGVGVGAAWLYALLPLGALYARIGYADHHAAVSLLATVALALYAAALDPETPRRALVRTFVALTLVRAALLLVWQGALLYLGPGELALIFGGAAAGRRDLLGGAALGALASALIIMPFVDTGQLPVGGAYSAVALSRFHLVCLAAAACTAFGLLALERLRPRASPTRGLARATLLSALVGGLLLLLPPIREGLAPALAFLGKAELHAATTLEQLPLFHEVAAAGRPAAELWLGYFAYLVPVVPLAFLWGPRPGVAGAPAIFLFVWSLLFGGLALQQLRWGNDFAPVACLGFALLLAQGRDLLPRLGLQRPWVMNGLVMAIVVILLWPALRHFHAIQLRSTLDYVVGSGSVADRALSSVDGTLVRFAETVRSATPGPRDATDIVQLTQRAEYAILCHPSLSHALRYVALRTTPADNFGPYVAGDRYLDLRRFFDVEDEEAAVALMQQLDARYLVTHEPGEERRETLAYRLHRYDGLGPEGKAPSIRFRLVTEGPRGGLPLQALYAPPTRPGVPYKLFEQVPGAVLEIPAPPGGAVSARVVVETPLERRFPYRIDGRADDDGIARLRVPYATRTGNPTRPLGPYRIFAGDVAFTAHVSDGDVREGRSVIPDRVLP